MNRPSNPPAAPYTPGESMFGVINRSLRTKLVTLIASLLAGVLCFVIWYFPQHMEQSARDWAWRRATDMTTLLAISSAPGLEFDDTASVNELLSGLSVTHDVVYAAVRRANGSILASYKGELLPLDVATHSDRVEQSDHTGILRVDLPIRAKGGPSGPSRSASPQTSSSGRCTPSAVESSSSRPRSSSSRSRWPSSSAPSSSAPSSR